MALKSICDALLSSAVQSTVQFLFERICSKEVWAYLRGKSNKSCDLEELVGKLKNDLTLVMAVIEDAENKQRKSKSVELWLDNLQDAVFHAEDLLDDIEYEAMRQTTNTKLSVGSSRKRKRNSLEEDDEMESKVKKVLEKFKDIASQKDLLGLEKGVVMEKALWRITTSLVDEVFGRDSEKCEVIESLLTDDISRKRKRFEEEDEMESKVKKVLEKFKDIASQKDLLGLERSVVMEKASWRLTACLVDESHVYGRDSEKREVVESLLSDDMTHGNLSVVSIVGLGGLGKTTLAQLVFNESEVKNHFEVMAWVCVSEEFDVCRVTKAILDEVTSQTCDGTVLNSLQKKLKERLRGKNFLIVLDDVWCENAADLDDLCLPSDWCEKVVDLDNLCLPFKHATGLDTCKVIELNDIQVQLKEMLTGKKFLIVLDDVWCENAADLDDLCLPLKHGAQGSKILVTTRNKKVSLNMRAAHAHNLKTLSNEACWELFASQASGVNGDFTGNSDVERIGREIVKKCKGLPIALKTLGGLLRGSLDVSEWKRIVDSDIWDLPEDKSDILPALKLSYHYLPSQLKRCFAYCSIFPSDYEFKKEELVLLWMAENFLDCPNKSRRMEDVGDEYFNGLVSRSFFQQSKIDNSKFVMHDLVHALAKFVSKEYCLLIEEDKESSQVKVEKVRHVGYMGTGINHYRRFNNILQSLNLRTFLSHLPYGGCHISTSAVDELLLKLRCLRVLSLSGYKNVNQLPESIGELSHLRSLDLSRTRISSLPESVCKLFNLQTLKLYGCEYLTKLPKDMHHLIKLRYLDLRDCSKLVEMPTQISKLKNLQILSTFIVGIDSGTKIGELRELSHLRREISIKKLENVKDSSDQARMMDKEHLETLNLEWSNDSNDSNDHSQHAKDVLGMLMPNKALKELRVKGYTGKDFPNWIASNESLRNIVSIQLSKCRNCLSLPPLGQLLMLKKLDISYFDALVSVGREFYGDAKPFPALESLKFSDMVSWESWFNGNSGGFSMLTELEVINCEKLTGDLPFFLRNCEGLDSLQVPVGCLPSTLKKLIVHKCSKLEFQFDSPHISLEQLSIRRCCSALRSFPLDFFPMLKEVDIAELKSLESFSISHRHLTSLNKLTISDCPELVSFTQDGLLNSLTELKVLSCSKLIASMKNWQLKRLPNLKVFEIGGSDGDIVESFPEEGLLPASITCLKISEFPCLKSLDKNGLQQLTSLVNLEICKLPKLQEIPREALPNSLQDLTIDKCDELQSISEEGFPTSLERFEIRHCRKCQIKGLPASLKVLSIYGFDELERMPDQVLQIPLQRLVIVGCPKFNINDFPSSLQELVIMFCPLLARKCKEEYENNIINIDGVRLIRTSISTVSDLSDLDSI